MDCSKKNNGLKCNIGWSTLQETSAEVKHGSATEWTAQKYGRTSESIRNWQKVWETREFIALPNSTRMLFLLFWFGKGDWHQPTRLGNAACRLENTNVRTYAIHSTIFSHVQPFLTVLQKRKWVNFFIRIERNSSPTKCENNWIVHIKCVAQSFRQNYLSLCYSVLDYVF